MRDYHLKTTLSDLGGTFERRNGIEIPMRFESEETEYYYIRDNVGLTDFSFMQKYIFPEEEGVELLDKIFPGNVAKLRFGRILHTFLPNDNGEVIADCYIANNDDEIVVLCESIVEDAEIDAIFSEYGGNEAGMNNITYTHSVLNLDGFNAWKVVREQFGLDVLSLPYLTIERYPFEDIEISIIRAGKTSEFGYQLIVPNSHCQALFETLLEKVKTENGNLCGLDIHNLLRLEGNFFNIFTEGESTKNPLELGLQWMIDFNKSSFKGSDAIHGDRKSGLKQKLIGISYANADVAVDLDSSIYDSNQEIATIKALGHSYVLDQELGLALFPIDIAYSGLEYYLDDQAKIPVQTLSMPPIMPKSLSINLSDY